MNKYIRSFPTFLVIREIHFKAKMRYTFTTTDNTKRLILLIIGKDRATGTLYNGDESIKWYNYLDKLLSSSL